jgi:hypothetical protein
MNSSKKILGGAIAAIAIFFFFGALTLKTNAAGSVSLSADQNTLTLSGSTSGSINLGDVDCFLPSGARAFINTTNPADPNGYTISNSSGVSVLNSGSIPGWTETDPGNSESGCGGSNPRAIPPTYSFGGKIDVSALANGTYTMAVLVGNEATGKIDQITASFTISRAAIGSYSFTPLDLAGLGLNYNASTQMLTLTGSMDVGSETFNTVGGGCSGTPNGTYSVTAPMNPQSVEWTIKNSSGATVLNGQSPFDEWSGNTPVSYSFPCATRMANSVFTMASGASLSVSSLSPGTYTFNTVVTEGNCIASSPDTFCPASVIASIPKSTWSGKFTVPVPTSTLTGTITVTSENANDPSVLVPAKWDLSGNVSGGFVCSAANGILWENSIPCSGTSEVYPKLPANNDAYDLRPETAVTSTTEPYSFNSFEQLPIAENKRSNAFVNSFALSLKNIFSTVAEAATVSPSGSWTLTPSRPSGAFIILWNPLVAGMQVSPTTVSFTSSGSMSQAETITATGAPSANLDWTASASTATGGNWLSVSPSSGSVSIGGSGSGSGTATISAASGLPNGTYQGTVTFLASGQKNPSKFAVTRTVSVTLVVTGNSQTPQYSCTDNACSEVSSGGVSSSSCIAACGEKQYGCVNNACAIVSSGGTSLPACQASCGGGSQPGYACENNACTPVSSGGVSQSSCQAACGGGGGGGSSNYSCVNNACVLVSSGGTSLPNCEAACNGGHGGGTEYSCVNNACATVSSGGTSLPDCKAACGTPKLPACTPGVNCPVCSPTLTATPSTIVVPESSNLSYSCSRATECQISGASTGQFSTPTNVSASGNVSTTPPVTTTYNLTCVNSNYSQNANNPVSSNATVTVSGSSYCEQNPNGVGCQ